MTRFEALRAKDRLFKDPEWVKDFMARKVDAVNSFNELTVALQETGGAPTKDELKVGEYSVEPSNG
jgi:hypothetical protein